MNINELIKDLNPQQRQAVSAGPGQVLVLAGPGSGKTRVLTYRVAYLALAQGVAPYHILAVTFTNKAAREMGARLEQLLGEEAARQLWLGTFHAVCARILRREAEYLPFKENFVIMDADDQQAVVKRAIRDLNLDEKLYRPPAIHAAISSLKNDMIGPEDFKSRTYRDEIVGRVYKRYQELLIASNAVDFDDLLLYAVRLLEEHPSVCEKYGARFEQVLVDEFQDTNAVQYRLLQLLASGRRNLFVVGDEDQAIYRWRGADYRNVLRFEKDYPDCQKILLEQNYRSTQTVLDAARAVINRNTQRTPKNLFTERGRGDLMILHEAINDHAEADYVVSTIRLAISSGLAKGSDFAVMYRTNAQSRLLEEAFLREGVPYRLVGAQRFYGRREVKDLIAYLRLVQNPADEISLARVINVPPRGIGEKTISALQVAARQAGAGPGAVLLNLGANGEDSPFWKTFAGRAAGPLATFGEHLAGWRDLLVDQTLLPALFDRIVADTLYQAYIDDGSDEGVDRWENVQELRRIAYEYQERGLSAFLETLALVSDQDTLPEQPNAPTLLTLHAAKGLEFANVMLIGLDESLLPHSRSLDDPEEMAEERRLFYVGITRAKNRVYLVRAAQRTTYGSFEVSIASRFLKDIPEDLIQRSSPKRSFKDSSSSWKDGAARWRADTRWDGGAHSPAARQPETELEPERPARRTLPQPEPARPVLPPARQQYQSGLRVRHPVWGEGLVVTSQMLDQEEVIEVSFDTIGAKRLLAALAKLEIIR
jgi:DNA helicase-2/ATP-dependent DNA helicase PcrA